MGSFKILNSTSDVNYETLDCNEEFGIMFKGEEGVDTVMRNVLFVYSYFELDFMKDLVFTPYQFFVFKHYDMIEKIN